MFFRFGIQINKWGVSTEISFNKLIAIYLKKQFSRKHIYRKFLLISQIVKVSNENVDCKIVVLNCYICNIKQKPKKMNKILLTVALISCSLLIQAQENKYEFGFKISPNIGWVKPNAEGYERDGVKAGISWGLVSNILLTDNYYAHTGFNVLYLNGAYSMPHKFVSGSTSQVGTLHRELRLKYIQIPAVLRMNTNLIGNFTYYGEFGIGLAFKTGAKADDRFSFNGTTLYTENKIDVSKDYRFSRESLIIGIGAMYELEGSIKLTSGLRFDNNFFDIMKGDNSAHSSIENQGISNFVEFHLGLIF